MKFVIVIITCLIFNSDVSAQRKKADDYVKFKENAHDLGKIKQGSIVTFPFLFDNISQENVEVESVIPPCGCMVSSKPETAVAKGKSESIDIDFSASKVGPFSKTITIKLVGVEKPMTITLTGEVLAHEDYLKYEKDKQN